MSEAAEARATQRRTPWLAHDIWRHLLSLVIASILLVALTFVGGVVALLVGDPAVVSAELGSIELGVTIVLSTFFVYGLVYLALTAAVFGRRRGDDLRHVAASSAARSSGKRVMLILVGGDEMAFPTTTVLSALAAVAWVVLMPDTASSGWLTLGAVAGITGGWIMMVMSFSVSYLREWAIRDSIRFSDDVPKGEMPDAPLGSEDNGGSGSGSDGGSDGNRDVASLRAHERRFSDFFYVAVQFATSYATTDFQLRGHRVRKFATLNSILAFLYGTVIIGMFLSFAVSAGLSN